MWLYCDDTSGNSSKKWNKHNSILLTLAGLPRHLADARDTGIEVWDSLNQEKILVIPWVLAFLGDNPMASEFASHIGMSGKCFCRICKVRGADEKNRDAGAAGARARLKDFMNAGEPRTKADTLRDLDTQLKRALQGAPSALDEMARESGSKDKYFEYFVGQLQREANWVRDTLKGQAVPAGSTRADQVKAALQEFRDAMMPENIVNPTLSIPDFDPNQDSPFEVLHVLLLGMLKYFWRDAVSRQSDEGKNELKTRLSSFDGMVPDECYKAWLALCRLAPLMFQPVIENLSKYSNMPSPTLWPQLYCGRPSGLISQSFIYFYTYLRTSGDSGLLRYTQQRALNRTT
ncbi:hypothetical protein B0H21DRAFT_780213 [Amylocystis lapponica]|nr:hypothetical protein B0H21DRAFT_780213 [Amylocystis lapponica]